ncbi:MAG: PIN domain-containing protein [Candidatus Hydrothermarchaeales archaeon]
MELVIDANILFAALIKSGKTRELLLNDELAIYAPEFLIEEFMENLKELEDKVGVGRRELEEVVEELITNSNIKIIPKKEIEPYILKAKEISPDPKDFVYLALALRKRCGIWSNDKRLKVQGEVKVYSTKEILELL